MSIFDIFKKLEEEKEKTPVGPCEYIVAGLGNPGEKYRITRHNAGFLTLDYIAEKRSVKITSSRFKALCGEGTVSGKKVLFMKPQTFMNASGEALREAAEFYKIPPEKIIVICDDITGAVGAMRIRRKGSDGGQRGLKSIIYQLQSEDFPRIRLGVGDKPQGWDLADWVLSRFTPDEQKLVFSRFADADGAMELIISGKTDEAMSKFNRK